MQHLKHSEQVSFKDELLTELLNNQKVFPINKLMPLQADPWGYRHKARIGVKYVPKKVEF